MPCLASFRLECMPQWRAVLLADRITSPQRHHLSEGELGTGRSPLFVDESGDADSELSAASICPTVWLPYSIQHPNGVAQSGKNSALSKCFGSRGKSS